MVAIYASSYVLVMTAVDRYVAICYPFVSHTWSNKKVHTFVVFAWALSLVLSIPQLLIFSYKTTPHGQMDCWATFEPAYTLPLYITIFTVLVYILPTGILTFCYGNICIEVWHNNIRNQTTSSVAYTAPGRSSERLTRSKIKTVKMTLTVVLCYFLCWSPFFIAQMWAAWDESAPFNGE